MESLYDPEGWEREYWIYEEERWDDLVELRKEELEADKDDENLQTNLGDAYVLAGKYEKALVLMGPQHYVNPENKSISRVILDALKGLGKNEDDFNWQSKPEILRLDESLFEKCVEILKKKRKNNRTMLGITSALSLEDKYLDFDSDKLEAWLKRDIRLRFVLEKNKIIERIEIMKKK